MLHPIPGLNNKNKRKFIFIHGARNNSLECQGEAEAERWEAVLKLTSPCPWKVLLGGKAQISYLEDWSVHYPLCHKYLKDFNFVIFLGRNGDGAVAKESLTLSCIVLYYLVSWELLCLCSHQIRQLGQSSACLKASVSLINYIFLLLCSYVCFSQISLFT